MRVKNVDQHMLDGAYSFPLSLQGIFLPSSQLSHVKDVAVIGAIRTNFAKAVERDMSKTLWPRSTCYWPLSHDEAVSSYTDGMLWMKPF